MGIYSVEEANSLIDELAPLLSGMRDATEVAISARENLADRARGNGHLPKSDPVAVAVGEFRRGLERLEELDILLRDPMTGLIDFPTVIDGEEAYLCWHLGEESVQWWHPLDAGVAGRRRLPD